MKINGLNRQVNRLQSRLKTAGQASDRLTSVRLVTFVGGFVLSMSGFLLGGAVFGFLITGLALLAFGGAVYYHRQVLESIAHHEYWLAFKKTQLARLQLDWDALPESLPGPLYDSHPFETDLDVTGSRSLHHLLDTTTSQEGSRHLAEWLLATTPDLATIEQRQAIIRELIPQVVFREKAAMYASIPPGGRFLRFRRWQGRVLLEWLDEHSDTHSFARILPLMGVLAVVNLTVVVLLLAGIIPPILLLFSLLPYAGLVFHQTRYTGEIFGETLKLGGVLRRLHRVFDHLETHPYRPDSALLAHCAPLLDEEHRPSVQIRRLSRLTAAASVQQNPLLWLIVNFLLPYDVLVAQALNRHKRALIQDLPVWLRIWSELEAYNALANFAWLHPGYTFPVVQPESAPFVFKGTQFGHPLIDREEKVCNDFEVAENGQLIIITGSNMAGKSSFLRTLGLNLALAYAGGVVNATSFETGLFRLFTCIKVSDSLADGISYFYAEVRRLKALLNALKAPDAQPLFFLIDEIFRGTNNRERLIGSRAYISALVGENGFGLVSTHDLELIKLADDLPSVLNMHFREEVIEGRMVFDYRLREGPCPTTNALRIMEMEGLPVPASLEM